jgi:hypothetical protein
MRIIEINEALTKGDLASLMGAQTLLVVLRNTVEANRAAVVEAFERKHGSPVQPRDAAVGSPRERKDAWMYGQFSRHGPSWCLS